MTPDAIIKKSISLWKGFHENLSFDNNIQQLHISLVLCCDCCIQAQSESMNHILTLIIYLFMFGNFFRVS